MRLLHGKRFYQLGTGDDTERLHACMGSPVYDEEADRGRPQVSDHLERDVLSYSMTAKCETLAEPCCLKIGGS